MKYSFQKTIFLTGATRGLGRELAVLFKKKGYKIIATDIFTQDSVDDKSVFDLFTDYYSFDLSDISQISGFVESVCGKHKIGILINNAGILDFKRINHYDDSDVEKTINVNLTAPVLLSKAFIKHFRANKYGRIINISSSSSFKGFETGSLYTSSKGGINLFNESLDKDLEIINYASKSDITVNNVAPSRVATPEFLNENPDITASSLVEPQRVFDAILELVYSGKSGRMITVFDNKYRLKLMKKMFHQFVEFFIYRHRFSAIPVIGIMACIRIFF